MSFNRASFRDSETDYIGELTDMNQPDNPIFETDNLTMLTDFYELTMANGFFQTGNVDKIAYFDMFFRRIPDNGGLAIMAGVEQLVQYLKNLRFTDGDIAYLRSKKLFNEAFLEYLRTFRFACDVWAVPGRHTGISSRTHCDGAWADHPGAVHRNHGAARGQPPVSDRHQGQSDRPGRPKAGR